ncbi:unnamed protein product, partial [Lepidochelys olivacea]
MLPAVLQQRGSLICRSQQKRMKTINCYLLLLCWKAICGNICELSNITIAVEKEECKFCINVNATWCSGYCFTR